MGFLLKLSLFLLFINIIGYIVELWKLPNMIPVLGVIISAIALSLWIFVYFGIDYSQKKVKNAKLQIVVRYLVLFVIAWQFFVLAILPAFLLRFKTDRILIDARDQIVNINAVLNITIEDENTRASLEKLKLERKELAKKVDFYEITPYLTVLLFPIFMLPVVYLVAKKLNVKHTKLAVFLCFMLYTLMNFDLSLLIKIYNMILNYFKTYYLR